MESSTNAPTTNDNATAEGATTVRTMPTMESILKEIDAKIEATNAKARELRETSNLLRSLVGEAPLPVNPSSNNSSGIEIRPNQFADIEAPSVAAKHFLWMRGKHAGGATMEEIASALTQGGFKIKNMHGLAVALARHHEICKIGNDRYGLVEWFPGRSRRHSA